MTTAFDIGGVILLGLMAANGLRKGLVDSAMKLIGASVAIYATMNYHEAGLMILQTLVTIPEKYASIVSFVFVFLVVLYTFHLIAFILRKLLRTLQLGWVDRIGGITFGLAKASLILSAFIWAFSMLPRDMQGTWQKESKLFPAINLFQAYVVEIFSLGDELEIMRGTVDQLMGRSKQGLLGISGESLLGGDSQNDLLQQALKSLGGGSPNALLEDLLKSSDDSGSSILKQAMQALDPAQKAALEDALKTLETLPADSQ